MTALDRSSLSARDRLIVALDLPSVAEARRIVEMAGDAVGFYKIGYQLGFAGGLTLARDLIDAGKRVFLDFKLHDIGNTVTEGIRSIAALGVDLTTVHAYPQTMRAAAQGKTGSRLRVIAVTVLTSYDEADCRDAGYSGDVASLVKRRVGQMCEADLDGVVCAATEAAGVRALLGSEQLIVTPGIRPVGAETGDQKRVVTPGAAIAAGADLLVVGRPITGAADPRRAAQEIVEEIASAL